MLKTRTSHEPPAAPHVWALVPAAGRSRRMGRPKALLPFGESTMIETVLATLRDGGASGILVVANPAIADAVRGHAGPDVDVVVNARPTSEMIESIQMALARLADTVAPHARDGCLVLPVDQPRVGAASVRQCVEAFRTAPDRIVIAARAGRRGHPIIFPWRLADAVHALPPSVGLNQLPRQHAGLVLEVPCGDEGVVTDIDTPEEYETVSGPWPRTRRRCPCGGRGG